MAIKNRILHWILDNPIKTIVVIAAIARLVVAVLYQHITIYPDSEDYIYLAERLSRLDLVGYQGQRSPGYPILICLAANLPLLTAVLQSIIGVITLIVFYKISIRMQVTHKVALIATLFAAAYLPALFYEHSMLSESLTLLVISLVFHQFLFIYSGQKNKLLHYLLLSLLCGLLVLIKPFYIFIPFILCIILYFNSIKLHFAKYIAILFFPIIAYTGWSYINKINTGYFVPTTFYGFNLAQNCVSFAENTSNEYTEIGKTYAHYRKLNLEQNRYTAMSIWEAYPQLKDETGLSLPDLSKKLYDYSIATIRLNPLAYLKQVAISWIDFWKIPLYCDYDKFSSPSGATFIRLSWHVQWLAMQSIKLIFAILIPFNIVFSIKRRRLNYPTIISLIVLTASILQAFATYGTNARFSFPFEFLILCCVLLNLQNMLQHRNKKG